MLTGVLLHVIEPAGPVDDAVHRVVRERRVQHVQDVAVLLVDDVDDAGAAQRAGVERLPAGGRIEGGAIEDHARPAVWTW